MTRDPVQSSHIRSVVHDQHTNTRAGYRMKAHKGFKAVMASLGKKGGFSLRKAVAGAKAAKTVKRGKK